MKKSIIFMLMVLAGSLYSQQDLVEILRADLKAEKVSIITETMDFTEQESTAFWPIFQEYDLELNKLNDQRVAIIKDFAEHFDQMTDVKADELVKKGFNYLKDRTALRQKFYKKFKKILPVMKAAKFMQVDYQLINFIDAQISMEMPLIEVNQ
ncbi:MAG: hypothetical protein P8048_07810 [Calditrichia bacterium]